MENNELTPKKNLKWKIVVGIVVALVIIIVLTKVLGGGVSGATTASSLNNLPAMVGGC